MEAQILLDITGCTLAKFIGIYFTIGGLGTAINGHYFQKIVKELLHNRGLQYNFAIIPLIIGSLIVSHYNVWSGKYIFVTIMGWILVTGGTIRICLAQQWIGWAKNYGEKISFRVAGIFSMLIGIGFLYLGYVV